MNGMFDIKLINNREKGDQYFQDAIDGGYIMDALDDLPTNLHLPAQHNRIFDNYAGCMIYNCLSGPAHANTAWQEIAAASTGGLLGSINLNTNSDTTSTYTENWSLSGGYNGTISQYTSGTANTTSASKRFIEDDITAPTIWSDTEREAIFFRNRFLYLPSQGNSNNIKSIVICAQKEASSTSTYYRAIGRTGRVRLRDANGVLATLNKTSSNSLLVEYTFSLVSW